MKKKIVGILVCTLLIGTAIPIFGMEIEDNIENDFINTDTLSDNKLDDGISPLGPFMETYFFGDVNITTYVKTTCLYMDLGFAKFNVLINCNFNNSLNETIAEIHGKTLLGSLHRNYTRAFYVAILAFSGTMNIESPIDDDGGYLKGNVLLFRISKYG